MDSNSEYGYTVRYKRTGSNKWKIYLVTNSLDSALWAVRWYEKHSPEDRKTGRTIDNADWDVFPITTFAEYRRRWRGCPF